MKTHTRWRQQIRADGDNTEFAEFAFADTESKPTRWTWTSPAGITHTDHPDPPLT